MSSEQQAEQFDQAPDDGAGYEPEPGFLVPQSEEAQIAAAYSDLMGRHPELADAEAANAAVASAAHLADYLDIPERAGDPGLIEMAHVLNGAAAAHDAAQQPPEPPDPVDAILGGGKGGKGGGVLNF